LITVVLGIALETVVESLTTAVVGWVIVASPPPPPPQEESRVSVRTSISNHDRDIFFIIKTSIKLSFTLCMSHRVLLEETFMNRITE
jgi:hypothetical protein